MVPNNVPRSFLRLRRVITRFRRRGDLFAHQRILRSHRRVVADMRVNYLSVFVTLKRPMGVFE